MSDPLASIPTLDTAAMPGPETWAAGVSEIDDWAGELPEPDLDPEFDAGLNPEVDVRLRLSADRAFVRRPARRFMVDWRANPDAYRHLKRLPREGESMHGIISGKYALFEIIPGLLARLGEPIADLHVVTLGFSKANGADLCDLIDGGQVRRVAMVCSHYFAKTSPNIYDSVVPELLRRGQRVVAMRSHCKMILARMAGGARFVCESSANLRSCVNVEQFVLTRCAKLHRFHRRWLESEILTRAASAPAPATTKGTDDAAA